MNFDDSKVQFKKSPPSGVNKKLVIFQKATIDLG
jgi:hypothetical protein